MYNSPLPTPSCGFGVFSADFFRITTKLNFTVSYSANCPLSLSEKSSIVVGEGGGIGLFITLVPISLIITFSYSLTSHLWGPFIKF